MAKNLVRIPGQVGIREYHLGEAKKNYLRRKKVSAHCCVRRRQKELTEEAKQDPA